MARLIGSIEKRSKETWRLRVTVGYDEAGKQIKKSRTTRTKRAEDREKELAAFIAEIEANEYLETKNILFRDFVADFKKKHVEKNLQVTTRELYDNILKVYLLPYFGGKKMEKINAMHIMNFLEDLEEQGKSPYVRRNALSVLRSVFTKAVEWRFLKHNPCENVKPPKRPKKAQKVFDEADLKQLYESLKSEPKDWQVLVQIAVVTGAREAEVAALEWKNVDLVNKTILFENTIVEEKGKGVTLRKGLKNRDDKLISIPDSLVTLLAEFKQIREREKELLGEAWNWSEHFFLFSNANGKPKRPDSIYQRWVRFLDRADLPRIRFHDIRHTSASLLISKGVHAKVIQERLGHSDIGTTMNIYSHVFREADQSAASHFDSLF